MSKKVDYNNLKYIVIRSGEEFAFDKLEEPMVFLNNIKKGKISLEEAKNLQQDYEEYLNKIRKGNKTEQRKALANISVIFNGRNNAIKFIENHSSIILEAKKLAKLGTGIKILTPKQMLQRLPIAIAQVKAGNNHELRK